MTPEQSTGEPESFTDFVAQRQSDNREIAVMVEGDFSPDPELGNAAAMRIAHILSDEGDVMRIDPDSAMDHSKDGTNVVVITLPWNPDQDEWKQVRGRLTTRIPEGVHIVVLVDTNNVPWFLKHLADVRVQATEIDAPLKITRLQFNPYSGEVYEREMSGIHGEDNER